MTEQNSEAEYLSDEDDEVENVLPKKLTVWLAIIFGLCALVSLALIIFYALGKGAKPSELNLGTVLIYCLTALVIVLIPWKKLGLRLKKVGFVEFERVIKTQKNEQIVEIVTGHDDAAIIDLGCGGGHVSFHVAPHVRSVIAYDL